MNTELRETAGTGLPAGRERRPSRWRAGIATLTGAVVIAIGAAVFTVPRLIGAHAAPTTPSRRAPVIVGATTGTSMIMYEGPLEMQMLRLSGRAPTWAEMSRVYTVLDAARKATARYRDLTVAERDGYYTLPYLYVEGQGYHYVNEGYYAEAETGRFDPTHPPVLVYNRMGGTMVLSGVMYIMPNSATPGQLAAIFPASMASWHRHINVCLVGGLMRGKIVGIHDRATCLKQGGQFAAHPFGWMVHAWIWNAPNGTGLFDMDLGVNSPATTLMNMGV